MSGSGWWGGGWPSFQMLKAVARNCTKSALFACTTMDLGVQKGLPRCANFTIIKRL
jgi:hypothetical protein